MTIRSYPSCVEEFLLGGQIWNENCKDNMMTHSIAQSLIYQFAAHVLCKFIPVIKWVSDRGTEWKKKERNGIKEGSIP